MIYTELTKRAAIVAYNAHAGQTDKAGMPYIFHPWHLAEQMTDEISVCVALLHDVVEDTSVTFGDLEGQFPREVIAPLKLLTREKGTDYFDYIRKIKADPVATAVKIADLKHNADLSRFSVSLRTQAVLERAERYKKALAILSI